jgi:hypothetical protein
VSFTLRNQIEEATCHACLRVKAFIEMLHVLNDLLAFFSPLSHCLVHLSENFTWLLDTIHETKTIEAEIIAFCCLSTLLKYQSYVKVAAG